MDLRRCSLDVSLGRTTVPAGRALLTLAAVLVFAGCASSPRDGATERPPDPEPSGGDVSQYDPGGDEPPGLLELCRVKDPEADPVDEARRRLQETFCGATLWLDGLFGGEPDVANARRTSGRVELGVVHSRFDGWDVDGGLRLRYTLPTLSERVSLFLGRGDREDFVRDRAEARAFRSSTLDRRAEEEWLAGLGYRPPGRWARGVDFRAGVRPRTTPEPFTQMRVMWNIRATDRSLWRLRETLFWTGREGFGVTTGIGYDRLLAPDLLLHWTSLGTISEASAGLDWRSASVLYHNLGGERAVAGEVFLRGATSAAVPLREYGVRGILRLPLRPHLFAELAAGYSWPREEPHEKRSGSPMVGIGAELHFGVRP